jgi:hypothetical protein
MSQQSPSPASPDDQPKGDPWHAFGYIVSGVGVYGMIGWLADRWLGTSFLVAVGILVGAGFGIYMTYARFNTPVPGDTDSRGRNAAQHDSEQD